MANLSATFSNLKETENSEPEVHVEKLYAQIRKLKVELDFLKKMCKEIRYTRERKGIKISMDGKGHSTDNIWLERLGKTIKYNHIEHNPTETGLELFEGVQTY